jgi:type II secretory pathway component GspD/PulD (secretin)
MRKLALALTFALLPLAGLAQTPPPAETPKVTVKAKGEDVRTVLASIFEQANKQYVLPVNFRFALFLSLEDADFEKALSIVCKQTGLEAVLEDGIYHVRVAKKAPEVKPETKPEPKPEPKPVVAKPEPAAPKAEPAPAPAPVKKGILSPHVLSRKVTTRLQKAEIRAVFAAMAAQSKVPIEVDPEVPAYKLDAFLIKTSLKYALDKITGAANLDYRFTDRGTILVTKK